MSPPLRLLLFSPHGCGEHYNGPASFFHRLLSVDPRRFDVTLLHGYQPQEFSNVVRESVFLRAHSPTVWGLFRWIRETKAWLRENHERFDAMLALTGFHATVVPAHYAETELRLPSVVFIANQHFDLGSKPGIKSLIGLARTRQRLVRSLSGIVSMTAEIRAELESYDVEPGRIIDIPMGVDLRRFRQPTDAERQAARNALGVPSTSSVIAFSGQLVSRKRPHLLVEALGVARRAGLDWRLVFAGPAPAPAYRTLLEAAIREQGVSDRVHLLGFTRNVESVYWAADAYCLPSSNEGQPASVVEALASGLPAVITRFSGADDLIPDHSVGRIAGASGSAIFEGLCSVLGDQKTRLAAREHAIRRFSAEAVLDRYESLFRSISSRSRN
jgi:glycosyltransferase involved in cell wall biosynthesis